MMSNSKKVAAVTVSYGNRWDYLGKVLERVSSFDDVTCIVVVCNDLSENSYNKLLKASTENKKIIVNDLGYNSGSAKGFKEGIITALREEVDFIWLLDDDNLPRRDSLNALLSHKDALVENNQVSLACLLSYRPDRNIYKDAVLKRKPFLMLGGENSFLGFDLWDKAKKVLFKKYKSEASENRLYGDVAVAPYGGMFFHKDLIEKIGLPREDYYLYADDHEFSYRITKKGGRITLILESVLDDLEKSFHLKNQKGIFNTRYFKTDNEKSIFYSVRNNIAFEQNFVSNKLLYGTNKVTYIALLGIVMFIKNRHLWKFKVILRAIKDSKNISK